MPRLFGPMDKHGDGGRWMVALAYWKGKLFERNSGLQGIERLYIFPFVFVWRKA
jgi:hypothetical protein